MVSSGRSCARSLIDCDFAHVNGLIAARNQTNPKPAETLANPAGVGPAIPIGRVSRP
jgi:hypothetical protein